MGWTSPRTFSVAEVQTAAIFNVHIRDNLNYLKGNAGTVAIASGMTVAGTLVASDELTTSLAAGGSFIVQGTNNSSFARIKMLGKTAGGATIDWRMILNGAGNGELSFFESGTTEQMRIAAGGNVGIGTIAPQGKLHVGGAGGGFLFLSANGVDGTVQTLAAAGTVTQFAVFYINDRNNTGGAVVIAAIQALAPNNSFTIVNNDTMNITVTLGGAITVQRAIGTNGTHQINGFVVFK